MPTFRVTYRDQHPAETVEADEVDVEGQTHVVFRQVQLVIGRPRHVVIRRIAAAGVDRVDEL